MGNDTTRSFYKRALMLALPVMISNGITNFVSLLDNIMVGHVGTDQMSGVAIVNQLTFIYHICMFGGVAGIGIFTAQFFGKGDEKGIRYTFRLTLIWSLIIAVLGMAVLVFFGDQFITMFLHEDQGVGDVAATFGFAKAYAAIILIEFIPFALAQAYSSILKSCGETLVPMKASVMAVLVNLIGNYILIFGKFGAPEMGVAGAALATALSRFVEIGYIIIHTHSHKEKYPFIIGAFSSIYAPAKLIKNCAAKSIPLLMNEALWAGGQAMMVRNYSLRGLSVVAGFNISLTLVNIFSVVFLGMGVATGILIGQELGKGNTTDVSLKAGKLSWFSVGLSAVSASVLFALSFVFPRIYNTSVDIQTMAGGLMRAAAVCMPIQAYANSVYFTIRSGGKTWITFFFDSVFYWVTMIPVSYLLVTRTDLYIVYVYFIVLFIEIIKCIAGRIMIRSGRWINDLTNYA